VPLAFLADDPDKTVLDSTDLAALDILFGEDAIKIRFWATVETIRPLAMWGGRVNTWLATCRCCTPTTGKQIVCDMKGRNAVGLACGKDGLLLLSSLSLLLFLFLCLLFLLFLLLLRLVPSLSLLLLQSWWQ
jgi:hypothetical protein